MNEQEIHGHRIELDDGTVYRVTLRGSAASWTATSLLHACSDRVAGDALAALARRVGGKLLAPGELTAAERAVRKAALSEVVAHMREGGGSDLTWLIAAMKASGASYHEALPVFRAVEGLIEALRDGGA